MSKYNFNIDTIDDNEEQNSLSKSTCNPKSQNQLYEIHRGIIDLELPSGTKWCAYNLGCNFKELIRNPENSIAEDWFGDYYAWGEIKTKKIFDWYNYDHVRYIFSKRLLTKYCNNPSSGYEKYCDNFIKLQNDDDAAYQNMHIGNYKFHIPTKQDFEELLEYTTNEYIENYNDIEGLNGILFKGTENKNELFFPATGFHYDTNDCNVGFEGDYWSSSLNTNNPNEAWYLHCYYEKIRINCSERDSGYKIRAITKQNITGNE